MPAGSKVGAIAAGFKLVPVVQNIDANLILTYAVDRVLDKYSGPVLRVRRVSDQAEADVYGTTSTGLRVPTGDTVAAWANGAQLRVVTWYDRRARRRSAPAPIRSSTVAHARRSNAGRARGQPLPSPNGGNQDVLR